MPSYVERSNYGCLWLALYCALHAAKTEECCQTLILNSYFTTVVSLTPTMCESYIIVSLIYAVKRVLRFGFGEAYKINMFK